MTSPHPDPLPDEAIPEAVASTRSGFSIVWLIPLVAAVIGAWVAWQAYSERGPTITIVFKTAEGLVAGKTKVKFKDVEVGQVESIDLEEDLEHVLVTVAMHKGAEALPDRQDPLLGGAGAHQCGQCDRPGYPAGWRLYRD